MFCRDASAAQSIQASGVWHIGMVNRAVISTHVNVRSLDTEVVHAATRSSVVGGRRGQRTVWVW